jgi:hypothetical protein
MKTQKKSIITVALAVSLAILASSGCSSNNSTSALKQSNQEALAQIKQQQLAHPTNVQAVIDQNTNYINHSAVPPQYRAQTIEAMKEKTQQYYASLHGGTTQ